ncbi:MAG: hypothetical protein JSR25_15265 [Proteobacteria bacterium]|nr:hypothetical protein [Pseudomonadota bacterium]
MPDREKVDALVQLAGTVAHELNNIFTAVAGNMSLLESSLNKQDQNAGLVSDIIRTTNRGIELSQKLQSFAGRQKLNVTQFDLNRSVITTIGHLKHSLLRGIEVAFALEPTSCMVATDQEKFQSMVEELIKNAVTAMDHRGRIAICTSQETLQDNQIRQLPAGNYIRFSVHDTGSGMCADVMRRALDPLFSTRKGHQGWGLAKCAGFVRQCKGDIILSSVKGQGSAVEVYLPRN